MWVRTFFAYRVSASARRSVSSVSAASRKPFNGTLESTKRCLPSARLTRMSGRMIRSSAFVVC